MTRMPRVREMIKSMSDVPLADDVSPDEAVAIGAAMQGVLSLLGEEDAAGERVLPLEVREQFSSEDGSLIRVTNITTHTLGVVLWDDARVEEYVFPDDPQNDARAERDEELLRHGQGEHEERHRAGGGRREHGARPNARRWASATSSCRPFCPKARPWN